MELDGDDAFSYPELYRNIDWLLQIDSQQDADILFDTILKYATPSSVESLVMAYFSVNSTSIRRSKVRDKAGQSGGGDKTHPEIYALLACADTTHDFADTAEEAKEIVETLQCLLPVGMEPEMMLNENRFIKFLARRKVLKFGECAVMNPLYRANMLGLLKQWNSTQPVYSMDSFIETQQHYAKSVLGSRGDVSLDIFTVFNDETRRLEVLKLCEVIQLCQSIRNKFGERCVFLVDNASDQLVILITATEFLTNTFERRFKTDPPASIAEVKLRIRHLRQEMSKSDIWFTETVDANLFDATANASKLPLNPLPTGPIFSSTLNYQITLLGASLSANHGPHVKVEFRDGDETFVADLKNKECIKYFSSSSVAASIDMGEDAQKLKNSKNLATRLMSFSRPMKYALKRAGDWSQVEHCVRYNKIFVTADKLAALYAQFRGIQLIFLKRSENLANKYGVLPDPSLPKCVRYTFTLSGLKPTLMI